MSWYYAGLGAKPVGPLTLDELRALREQGTVKPETFVIEHTGQAVESMTWKRYQDVVPASASLPPLPPLVPVAPPPPVPPVAPVMAPQPHPLFPSATNAPAGYPTATPGAQLDPYRNLRPTNGWCAWGFGLGLASFLLCGFGLIPPLIAIVLCVIGLVQVSHHHEQGGRGLAVAGLILSVIAALISLAILVWFVGPMFKGHEITVTEQTSNDSE